MNKDLFPIILSHTDIFTLFDCKKINKKFYNLVNREIGKRRKSKYPFGDINAKIYVSCKDFTADSVHMVFGDRKIFISENNYSILCVRDLLTSWFFYNFTHENFVATSKLFKSIIKILNKRIYEAEGRINVNIDYQTLIFSYREGDSFLENVH